MQNPWADIEKPATDLNVRLVDEGHPLKLYWGVDPRNRYSFAFDAAADALPHRRSLPSLLGIEAHIAQQGLRGKLVLILQSNADWEIFRAICSDLVQATSAVLDESAASAIFVRRLLRWQELLRKKRPELLSTEEIKGLFAELLFLRTPLATAFGYDDAVAGWRGPVGGPQDFAIRETAVEVKCQSGGSKPIIRINSAEQLCPQLPEAFLVVYTLANQPSNEPAALSLNALVAAVRNDLSSASAASRDLFEELLYMAGFLARDEYDEVCFSVVSIKCYGINDSFPRIRSSGLAAGIESVSYSLRLDQCAQFQSKPDWWKDVR